MLSFWIGLVLFLIVPVLGISALLALHIKVVRVYIPLVVRIFQEKPLFIIPRGQPIEGAEVVRFKSEDGLTLSGCYWKTDNPRRGVILFGLEFGSNCWSCRPYCEHLIQAGFDVFAFETRNQGTSDVQPGYEPLQWVTEFEIRDARAAVAYLKSRPDADPRGVGLFGISKGAGAGVFAAAEDDYIRCCVTDGMFATRATTVPYMFQWFKIYNRIFPIDMIPYWYVDALCRMALRRIERLRGCRFRSLERAVSKLTPRPLLMIHGENDSYIKPDMARALFERAGQPREFWLVSGAKHNQALHLIGDQYRDRVLRFFERHLPPAQESRTEKEEDGALCSVALCAKTEEEDN